MSDGVVETLCIILENGSGRFRLAAYPEVDTFVLEDAGLVVRDGVVSSTLCDHCEAGHLSEVRRRENGLWGYTCPEAGYIEVVPGQVAAGQVVMEALLDGIAGALGVPRRARADISARILPIGNFWLGELNSFAWLAVRLFSPDDYAALHAEIWRRPFPQFGVVFMTAEVATSPFVLSANHHLISLREVVRLDSDGCLRIDGAALRAFVPKTDRVARGPPSMIKETWDVIQDLIQRNEFPMGRNERQRAASEAYLNVHPGPAVPRPGTIKDHLTKLKSQIDEAVKK